MAQACLMSGFHLLVTGGLPCGTPPGLGLLTLTQAGRCPLEALLGLPSPTCWQTMASSIPPPLGPRKGPFTL